MNNLNSNKDMNFKNNSDDLNNKNSKDDKYKHNQLQVTFNQVLIPPKLPIE